MSKKTKTIIAVILAISLFLVALVTFGVGIWGWVLFSTSRYLPLQILAAIDIAFSIGFLMSKLIENKDQAHTTSTFYLITSSILSGVWFVTAIAILLIQPLAFAIPFAITFITLFCINIFILTLLKIFNINTSFIIYNGYEDEELED